MKNGNVATRASLAEAAARYKVADSVGMNFTNDSKASAAATSCSAKGLTFWAAAVISFCRSVASTE